MRNFYHGQYDPAATVVGAGEDTSPASRADSAGQPETVVLSDGEAGGESGEGEGDFEVSTVEHEPATPDMVRGGSYDVERQI